MVNVKSINYNLILKIVIISTILYSTLKSIPSDIILNKDIILIIAVCLMMFYMFNIY